MLTSVSTPDLHLLRVFVAVAEAGGFSRAQIVLNVGQSTISTQMNDLETRLGMRLCRRGRAGFALTEEGHEIYRMATGLLRNCKDFVASVNSLRGEITGELEIATADSLMGNENFPLDRILSRLRDAIPAVKLHLRVMEPLEIERRILEQKLHMGIHTFPNHVPGLRYVSLFKETQVLYCGVGHPLFDLKTMPGREEVDAHDYASRSYYGGSLQPGGLKPMQEQIHSGNMDGIAAAILSGRFLGHLPAQCAKPYLAEGRMKPVRPDLFSYDSRFEAAFPVGVRLSRAQRMLESIVEGSFLPDG